jgi:hypothetical protein
MIGRRFFRSAEAAQSLRGYITIFIAVMSRAKTGRNVLRIFGGCAHYSGKSPIA